jgi:MHS family proline/betaine transporter-like MFS transporter
METFASSIFKNLNKRSMCVLFGTIVEYYDYSLYGFAANIIGSKFFKATDTLTILLNVFAVYAIGYMAKPLGALIFGRIGDLYGRKVALRITIIGIGVPTFIIGILPKYSTIGISSTVILVLCRFIQSIFVAGEYDGAAIYVMEHFGHKHYYAASAITRSTSVLGVLFGIIASSLFSSFIFPEWGWRVPFLLSLPLSAMSLYFRSKFVETPEFELAKKQSTHLKELVSFIRDEYRSIIRVILLAGGFGVTYQISTVFMKHYLPIILPDLKSIINIFYIILILCFGVSILIAGVYADKFRKGKVFTVCIFLAIIASIFLGISLLYKIKYLALLSCLIVAVSVAPFNGLAHATVIKSFATRERYRGISLGHTIGSMIFSGSANYICSLVVKSYNAPLFPIYYLCLFSIIAYLSIRSFDD